jgi:hypothetical protein
LLDIKNIRKYDSRQISELMVVVWEEETIAAIGEGRQLSNLTHRDQGRIWSTGSWTDRVIDKQALSISFRTEWVASLLACRFLLMTVSNYLFRGISNALDL